MIPFDFVCTVIYYFLTGKYICIVCTLCIVCMCPQLQRSAAYAEVSKQVSKWVPTIKRNREVSTSTLPLDPQRL